MDDWHFTDCLRQFSESEVTEVKFDIDLTSAEIGMDVGVVKLRLLFFIFILLSISVHQEIGEWYPTKSSIEANSDIVLEFGLACSSFKEQENQLKESVSNSDANGKDDSID